MADTQTAPADVHEGADGEILHGSNTLPATIEVLGAPVALGTIVAAAFAASGLTEDEWNALPDDERDALLNGEINLLSAASPDPAPDEPDIVDGLIGGDTLVPMTHPDGGSCDAFKADKAGKLLVPAIDVPDMLSHGFVVSAGDK